MSRKKDTGPSPEVLKLRRDLDNARRALSGLKKSLGMDPNGGNQAPVPVPVADDDAAGADDRIAELEEARDRLSRLYFNQLEENRKRGQKLQQILRVFADVNAKLDPDTLLTGLAQTIQMCLGFRIVTIRVREPGTDDLVARAIAGLNEETRARIRADIVHVDDFLSWLKDEFKVSNSYFISHKEAFNRVLPHDYVTDLGPREEWEWHDRDVLLVPLHDTNGDLVAYFSVDDPADRMIPTRENIELLEIFGHHAMVSIENAKLYRQLARDAREIESAAQRMKEVNALKSTFMATMSHELRTPLTSIRAYLDTLLGMPEGGLAHDQLIRFLRVINDETQRLARLIESVLDLNRFDSGQLKLRRQPVDLAEVVEDTARLLEPVGTAGQVSLKLEIQAADTTLEADRDQMRQLVLHLGSNAVKFTPAGGTATFRMQGNEREITLQVLDTGIGIPEEALEQVFERFFQVDSSLVRRYGGTGLGLSICRSIVEWHGGRVFATSQPGAGACFTVVLPRRSAPRVVVRRSPDLQAATEDVLKLGIDMVAEVMDARVVSLMAVEPSGDLVVQAAIGLDERVVDETRIPPGRGVAGWVLEQRRPVCVSHLAGHHAVAASGREKYRSKTFVAVPVEGPEGLLGVLNVTDPLSQRSFDAEDCHLLLDLAERIGTAWHQAQTLATTQANVQDTTGALRQLLEHVARGRRMAPNRVRLARAIAREIGLHEADIGMIGFAATVHDVGMTMVGQDSLRRGSVLTPEERERMERHAELGAELLRPLEAVSAVREIVLAHHEWWDGSGYPSRLAGADIPIGARVLAVVDAFESMTLGRAHRAAVTCEEAVFEIVRLKGRQFDPDVVEAFERALPALEMQPAESGTITDEAIPDTRR